VSDNNSNEDTIILGDGVNDILGAASGQYTTQPPSVMAPEAP
jgi:hypothetical protein